MTHTVYGGLILKTKSNSFGISWSISLYAEYFESSFQIKENIRNIGIYYMIVIYTQYLCIMDFTRHGIIIYYYDLYRMNGK